MRKHMIVLYLSSLQHDGLFFRLCRQCSSGIIKFSKQNHSLKWMQVWNKLCHTIFH